MELKIDLDLLSALILPLLGLFLSIWIYYRQKTKKQIAYKILSTESLPSFDKPASEIQNPNKKIIIQYINTGNTALEHSDFHHDILTNFIDAKILNAEKYKTIGDDKVNADLTIIGSNATFKPDLMNPGDKINILYEIQDFGKKIHIETKIKDGKPVFNKPTFDIFFNMFWTLAGIYFSLIAYNIKLTKSLEFKIDWYLFILISGPITIFYIKELIKKIKSQFVWYAIWDINR